jgi:hypothetical protein
MLFHLFAINNWHKKIPPTDVQHFVLPSTPASPTPPESLISTVPCCHHFL